MVNSRPLKIEPSCYKLSGNFVCYVCSTPMNKGVKPTQISKNNNYLDICGKEECLNIVIFKQGDIFK